MQIVSNRDLQKTSVEDVRLNARQTQLLSELQVTVGIELGKLSLSAAELIDMAIGTTISFPLCSDDSVLLRIGTEPIARAMFVQDGEELALEILEVYEETPPEGAR